MILNDKGNCLLNKKSKSAAKMGDFCDSSCGFWALENQLFNNK